MERLKTINIFFTYWTNSILPETEALKEEEACLPLTFKIYKNMMDEELQCWKDLL